MVFEHFYQVSATDSTNNVWHCAYIVVVAQRTNMIAATEARTAQLLASAALHLNVTQNSTLANMIKSKYPYHIHHRKTLPSARQNRQPQTVEFCMPCIRRLTARNLLRLSCTTTKTKIVTYRWSRVCRIWTRVMGPVVLIACHHRLRSIRRWENAT